MPECTSLDKALSQSPIHAALYYVDDCHVYQIGCATIPYLIHLVSEDGNIQYVSKEQEPAYARRFVFLQECKNAAIETNGDFEPISLEDGWIPATLEVAFPEPSFPEYPGFEYPENYEEYQES